MYMIFVLFDAVTLGMNVLAMLQAGTFGGNTMSVFIGMIWAFYSVAVYMSFETYKEFKAIYQESTGDIAAMSMIRNNPLNYGSLCNAFMLMMYRKQ